MKRHFTCKSNWTGVIIAYTLKREYGLNKEDIDAYNIFNNGVAFANASYITTPGNTEGVQGWCWGLFHKYDSSLPYVSWRTNEDINDIRRTVSQGVNNIFNEVIDGFRNISDIKFATLEEVTKLKDLVANDKVKLGCIARP